MDKIKRNKALLALCSLLTVFGGSWAVYGMLMQNTNIAEEAWEHLNPHEIEVPPGAQLRSYFNEDHGHYHYYLYFPDGEHAHAHNHDHNHHHNHSQDLDLPPGAQLRSYFNEDHGHYHYYLYFPDGEHGHEHTHGLGHVSLPAPDFEMEDSNGAVVNLFDNPGQPIVINFWASASSYSLESLANFEVLYLEFGHEVQFKMVNLSGSIGESAQEERRFVEVEGFSFPVFHDTQGLAPELYGILSIPQTFFVDAEGYIVGYALGSIDEETIRRGIYLSLGR